ncbi:hypothetical protein RSOL_551110, partial [Rhizoctonia solani AG-3 Rhs1AP]
IMNRLAGARTQVKVFIWPIVKDEYGFRSPAMTEVDVEQNKAIYKRIRENNFHLMSLDPREGQYEHHAVWRCMVEGLFYAPHAPVAVYHEYFRPALPTITVAFVLTIMQACIEEWRTGRFVPEHLNASDQFNIFTAHLLGLEEYSTSAPRRLRRFRKAWYRMGVENVTRPTNEQPVLQAYTTRDEVRPDSDSEDDEDVLRESSGNVVEDNEEEGLYDGGDGKDGSQVDVDIYLNIVS